MTRIRELVRSSDGVAVTDLSQGGLLAALVTLSPRARVTLGGDLFTMLFSETAGRFLIAFRERAEIGDLPCTIIGEAGGDTLSITAGTQSLVLEQGAISQALSSLSKIMRIE